MHLCLLISFDHQQRDRGLDQPMCKQHHLLCTGAVLEKGWTPSGKRCSFKYFLIWTFSFLCHNTKVLETTITVANSLNIQSIQHIMLRTICLREAVTILFSWFGKRLQIPIYCTIASKKQLLLASSRNSFTNACYSLVVTWNLIDNSVQEFTASRNVLMIAKADSYKKTPQM